MKNFLNRIKSLIKSNDYTIKITEKNKKFDRQYNLKDNEKKNILLSLTTEDCIDIRENDNVRYKEAEIYFFLKRTSVSVYGENNEIEIYIKMYIQECNNYDETIIISFHESGEYE